MLKLPAGEQRSQLVWLCAVSLLYSAAITVADDVAQSIFVAKLGVRALPNIFLIKAAIDVVSASLYLPLTRHRNPKGVWRALLLGYALMLGGAWLAITSGLWPSGSAYFLYIAHEAIWSLAAIHWGILLLALISPAQTKALFPVLFAIGRLGALLGGAIVGGLAMVLGAVHLLWAAALLALACLVASLKLPRHADVDPPLASSLPEPLGALRLSNWTHAWASPLVRWIALSTAMMVVLRYGLRIVSLAEIQSAFDNDKDRVAAFLGVFSMIGNAAALVLGIWVVPRVLARYSVGAANLAYATSSVLAFVATWLWPSLASASAARFVEVPLKHALKSPLSVMFYAAEKHQMRLAARALVFGAAIPLATAISGLGYRQLEAQLAVISMSGAALALAFVFVSARQNHSYRHRLLHTLEEILGPDMGEDSADAIPTDIPGQGAEVVQLIGRALGSKSGQAQSMALLYLGECLPYSTTKAITEALAHDPKHAQ